MIMRTGKKDADRLKAADRVLELLGFRDDLENVPGANDGQESDIDKQLKVLLVSVTNERLSQVIEATVSEADVDSDAA
jgi:hypothetical protein